VKIIIILEKYGGYCNRLFQSVHYHAYSMEKGFKFFNPTMLGLLKFDNYFFYIFDRLNNYFLRIFYKSIKILFRKNRIFLYFNKNNYIKIVEGWNFRRNDLTNKYHNQLNKIYKFDNNIALKSKSLIHQINKLKDNGKFIVGLHIRRNDYKTWNNGKFYFSDKFYSRIISQLKNNLNSDNYDPFIIAVSDEIINSINGIDCFSKRSWKDDQIILQSCDLIIGPPSTFTMWASYISKTPLIVINSEENFNFEKSKICKG